MALSIQCIDCLWHVVDGYMENLFKIKLFMLTCNKAITIHNASEYLCGQCAHLLFLSTGNPPVYDHKRVFLIPCGVGAIVSADLT